MLISEFIVGLWFVPVVLFIVIPLTVLCAWAAHQLLRKVGEKIEQTVAGARASRDDRAPSFRPRPAV